MRRTSGSRRTSSSRRYSARNRTRRRTYRNRRRFSIRRIIRPILTLVILAALGAGCYQVLTTPKLQVRKVRVTGTRLLDNDSIQLDVEKLTIGRNILILSKTAIVNVIVKGRVKRPEVGEISVGRMLPDTVVVRVKERSPYAVVTNGAGFWLVDKDGMPFHESARPTGRVPLVELPSSAQLAAGRPVKGAAMKSAMRCISDDGALKGKIAKISVDHVGNLCLNIGSEFYVKLGQPVEISEKLEKLAKVLAAKPEIGETALYIDVSCCERPVVKPKQGGGEEPVSGI